MSFKIYTDAEGTPFDITGYLDARGNPPFELELEANGRGSLSFTAIGAYSTLTSETTVGEAVRFEKPTGTVIWRGFISDVQERELVPSMDGLTNPDTNIEYRIRCTGIASILDRRYIRHVWTSKTVGQILDDLFTVPAVFVDGTNDLVADGLTEGTITTAVHGTTIDSLSALYKPAAYVLDTLARLTGAVWVVQPDKTIDVIRGAEWSNCTRNYPLNSSFELGSLPSPPTYWGNIGTPTTSESTEAMAYDGDVSYHLVGNGATDGGIQYSFSVGQTIGEGYTLSIWMYPVTLSTGATRVRLEVIQGGNTLRAYPVGTSAWERVSITWTATNSTGVILRLLALGGESYYDAIQWETDPHGNGATTYVGSRTGLPRDWHDIAVVKDSDRYSNAIYAAAPTGRQKEIFAGDGSIQTFGTLGLIISEPKLWMRTTGTPGTEYPRTIATSTVASNYMTLSTCPGGGFANQPWDDASSEENLKIKSSASDTMNATLIHLDDSGDIMETTKALNGTTLVTFDGVSRYALAVRIASPPDGVISLYRNDGTTLIVTDPTQGDTIGVYDFIDTTEIWARPEAMLDANGSLDTPLGIKTVECTSPYTTPELSWRALLAASGATRRALTLATDRGARTVTELYIGAIEAARTITLLAQYEWAYTADSAALVQNANTGDDAAAIAFALTSGQELIVEYYGLYVDEESAVEATEVTNRATDDGTTGLYEHVEEFGESYTATELDGFCDEMIDWYCRDGSTSYFPRMTIQFSTAIWGPNDADNWARPGAQFTATIVKHDISAVTFTITRATVTCRPVAAKQTSLEALVVRVTAVSGRPLADFAQKWRGMLPSQRRKLITT